MAKKRTGYEEALRRIAECISADGERLDLGGLELKAVPPEIGAAFTLKALDLSNNNLTELPPEIGKLTALESLELDQNRLTKLPSQIISLTNLTDLSLNMNRLTTLPPEIGSLAALKLLSVHDNLLQSLPPEIGALTALKGLYASRNRISFLPAEIGKLLKLEDLYASDNCYTELPLTIGSLVSLETLYIPNNELAELPSGIGSLTKLRILVIFENRLTKLPWQIGSLPNLSMVQFKGNPLPAAYFDAIEQGVQSFRAFLQSLGERTRCLFEAKLLVTGEGKVGKSWALAALRGADPHDAIGEENTTWGIDRGELRLAHPGLEGEEIVLNTWDFGGQEIYRVTHQFFFSADAIYLLVWNPRIGAGPCRVREWLRTIALRTGSAPADDEAERRPGARVIMVATHAQDEGGVYNPDYGRARLEPDLEQMIVGEVAIDSERGYNIDSLREMIAFHATHLPEMGQPVNERWAKARDAVLALRKRSPWIDFDTFSSVCAEHGVHEPAELKSLAWTYLHSLGRAVWYGDGITGDIVRSDEAVLANTVVLDAVWLSRAFVQVLEDEPTKAARGMLDHRRFTQIWTDHSRTGWYRYKPHEYEILKQVMRRFDVALPTRESGGHRSLVPQLVPVDPPALPWSEADHAPGSRTIRLSCQLDYEAIGLGPRLIAATEPWHVYEKNVGLFWEGGVFLRDTASFRNEALIRIIGSERPRIDIVVSGEQPAFLMYELFKMLESENVLGFWKGMTRTYSIGCPTRQKNNAFCTTYFDFEAVVRRIREQIKKPFDCARCDSDWSAEALLSGFEAILERDTQISDRYMLEDMFNRLRKLAPRLFLLESLETHVFRPSSWNGVVGHRFKITLLSEFSGKPVAATEFALARKWVKWIGPITRLASLALTGAAVPLGGDLANQFSESAALLDKLSELSLGGSSRSPLSVDQQGSTRLGEEQLASFAKFLSAIDLDPREHGMDIARGPDGKWYWMSAEEVETYTPQTAA